MERVLKYHGLGNDFVLVDRRASGEDVDLAATLRLCDRRRGVGADGVLVLLPSPSASASALFASPRLSRAAASAVCGGTPCDWRRCASLPGPGGSNRTAWQRLAIVGSTWLGRSVSRSSTT